MSLCPEHWVWKRKRHEIHSGVYQFRRCNLSLKLMKCNNLLKTYNTLPDPSLHTDDYVMEYRPGRSLFYDICATCDKLVNYVFIFFKFQFFNMLVILKTLLTKILQTSAFRREKIQTKRESRMVGKKLALKKRRRSHDADNDTKTKVECEEFF